MSIHTYALGNERQIVRMTLALFALILFTVFVQGVEFAVTSNPVPLINQPLVPAAVPGGIDFTLKVNGTGFVAGSVVNWNGVALATTPVDGEHLTAIIPAGNIATDSTASVTVFNPTPGGGTSNVAFF